MRRAIVVVCVALLLSGCGSINAWVAGAETNAAADAAGAANNLHAANTLAAQAWKRAACGLTLGGLAGASDAALSEAAIKMCTPAGVAVGGVTVDATPPVQNPFALSAASAARAPAQ